MKFALRFFALYVLLNLLLFTTGCTTSWVTEASGIIESLIPAVQGILVILSGLGAAALTPSVLTSVQTWGTQAMNDLNNVVLPLIEQYNAAEDSEKPGILTSIQAALNTIATNLATILPTLKITDPVTQEKVTAVITEVQDELNAVVALIPVVQGAGASPTPEALMHAMAAHPEITSNLKSEKQFRSDFNKAAGAFGKQFVNWIR